MTPPTSHPIPSPIPTSSSNRKSSTDHLPSSKMIIPKPSPFIPIHLRSKKPQSKQVNSPKKSPPNLSLIITNLSNPNSMPKGITYCWTLMKTPQLEPEELNFLSIRRILVKDHNSKSFFLKDFQLKTKSCKYNSNLKTSKCQSPATKFSQFCQVPN